MILKLLLNTGMIWMILINKNIEEYNSSKKRKILIVFDDMIDDMRNNKTFNSIVTRLFLRGRKLNISLAFITQSFFVVPRNIRLSFTEYFIMKIPSKQELQQGVFNHASVINFKEVYENVLQNHIHF